MKYGFVKLNNKVTYDASKKGAAIRLLDSQREASENALYSGGSIQAGSQYISNVFNKAGIPDSVAKNLLSKKLCHFEFSTLNYSSYLKNFGAGKGNRTPIISLEG